MRVLIVVTGLLLSQVAMPSPAQQPNSSARALVESGVAAYIKEDATAAIKAWVKGSALEANTQTLSQANMLRQVEDYYGKPQSIEVLKEVTLSPRSHIIYFTVTFEKGIAFARFQAYQKSDGTWVATEFRFHTDATQVFPSSMTDN